MAAVSVAHLIYGLGIGGLEQLVVQLAARSKRRGIEASILALGRDGPARDLAARNGVDVELLPAGGMTLAALSGIRRALAKRGTTVLHAHDLGPWLNAAAARMLRPRTRVMATFHEQRTPQGRKRAAASAAARVTDALVACGEKVRQDILGWAPAGARVPVIANGVPLAEPGARDRGEARAALGLPEGAVAIGYVGGLREIKGPDRLLQAYLDRFPEGAGVHLCFVGEGPLEGDLRRAAGRRADVHFAGMRLDAARLLPGFDVYAQASLSEGRSLSMLEAMGAGLPTVAHDLAPVREIHSNGASALLVPLGDRAGLGEALGRLASDPGLRARLGAEARRRARTHSIEPMVDAYEALYRELAARA